MARITGKYEASSIAGEEVKAFVPAPLPPARPPLKIDDALAKQLGRAEAALGQLDLAAAMVPSVGWFIYSFVRKEAVVSSQIEGTQASLIDLLTYEAVEKAGAADKLDVLEICNHLDALAFAREQLRDKKGLPLSVRLLNETHQRLMKGARGADKQPGAIRRSQNWIGGTRPGNAVYVPPPPHLVAGLLGDFEKFIHAKNDLHPLIKAGLLHVQFESIHPYLDGNGRIGRLLVTLLLEHWGLLGQPLLYLSLYFKRHRAEYYRQLGAVRLAGDFEGWLKFFVDGVAVIAAEAVESIRDLFVLVTADRQKVLASGSTSLISARLFEMLPEHPILTIGQAVRLLDTTKPTATKAVIALVESGVLVENTGRKRDRTFSYASYLALLRAGTELETPRQRRLSS